MNKLVLANLIHRPMRSVISAAAIAIEVVMIISVAAIFLGQIDGQKIRTNGIGADLIVSPPNASFLNAVSGAPIPAKNVEAIRTLPHVAVASPVIQKMSLGGTLEIIYGIDYASYNALRPFVFLEGGPFKARMTPSWTTSTRRPTRPPYRRNHPNSRPAVPHLRHRRVGQRRPQAGSHPDARRDDRFRRQGIAILRQKQRWRQSGSNQE